MGIASSILVHEVEYKDRLRVRKVESVVSAVVDSGPAVLRPGLAHLVLRNHETN